jgi:hypothetical protein
MRPRTVLPIFLSIFAIALVLSSVVYGQSLGDVARENREKQNAEDAASTTPKPKVITNADLPKDPNASPPEPQPLATGKAGGSHSDERHSASQTVAQQRVADQWKRQILADKDKLISLQERIDQLNASIHSVGAAQTDGLNNRDQARQLDRLVQVQQQFNEQKRKLEELQEDARRAGMHAAIYDP